MRTAALLAVLSAAALAATDAPCLGNSGAPPEAKLQTVLDKGIEKHDTRGVSSAIFFPDGRVWTGVSGISHETVPIDPGMLFGIGSVTKTFVAALALQLTEEGTISLEDTVSDYLPPIRHVEGGITIRQLLNHTSGLYMFWDNEELWAALRADRTRVWTPEEVLAYIGEPYFEPGEGWRYSNTNYLLLAMILEKATGSTLSREFRTRFWDPLGIEGFLSVQEEIPDHMAHVYGDNFQFGGEEIDVTYEPGASHESIIFGSGGLFMTAEDLARWSQALFGGEVLSDESMEEVLRFVSFTPVANMREYGLGVQVYGRRFSSGAEAIGHGGGNIGSSTYMVYLPEHETSIVAMVNAYPTRSIDYIAEGLIEEVLRDRGALGWIPYISRVPLVLIGSSFGLSLVFLAIFFYARLRKTA